MEMRPLDVDLYCKVIPGIPVSRLKAIEVAALRVAHAPSVNTTPIMHFQASVWALSCLDDSR